MSVEAGPDIPLDLEVAQYLDAFHAFDAVATELDAVTEAHSAVITGATNPADVIEANARIEENTAYLLGSRDAVLRRFIGSTAVPHKLSLAVGLYIDEHAVGTFAISRPGDKNPPDGGDALRIGREAVNRVRSYAAIIALTQYQGAVPRTGGRAFPRRNASLVTQAGYTTVRLHGVPDDEGRSGIWVDISNPRGVEVVSAADVADLVLADEVGAKPELVVMHKITGTYDVLGYLEHDDGSITVTAHASCTDQEPFTVTIAPDDRVWRLSPGGRLLHMFIPSGVRSIEEFDGDMAALFADQDEAATEALRAAGGPQHNVIEGFDRTGMDGIISPRLLFTPMRAK